MTKAFLVAGASHQFLEEVRQFETFLKISGGVSEVQLCLPAYFSAQRLEGCISEFFKDANPDDVLLIGYVGHGDSRGWGYSSDDSVLRFQFLAETIQRFQNNVLVVNACCYSYALAQLMVQQGVSLKCCGIIANSHKETSYNLIRALLSSWSRGQCYQPPYNRERIRLISETAPLPWWERSREWWLRTYAEFRNMAFPRRESVIYGGCVHDSENFREVVVDA